MLSGGPGVDVVLEMAGDPDSICTAFDIVRRNGLAIFWKELPSQSVFSYLRGFGAVSLHQSCAGTHLRNKDTGCASR
jgi:hypothetical protein